MCSYFQAKKKTTCNDLDQVDKLVNQLLYVLGRPARLLECLEFDPGLFYSQLEMEEPRVNQEMEMGEYIRMKLSIPTEPEEGTDFQGSENADGACGEGEGEEEKTKQKDGRKVSFQFNFSHCLNY